MFICQSLSYTMSQHCATSKLRKFSQELCSEALSRHTWTHRHTHNPLIPLMPPDLQNLPRRCIPRTASRVGIGVFSGKKATMVIKPQFLMCTLNSTTNGSGLCVTTPDNYHPRISGTTSRDIPPALLLLPFPTSPFTISSLRVTIHPRMAIHPFSNPLLFFFSPSYCSKVVVLIKFLAQLFSIILL